MLQPTARPDQDARQEAGSDHHLPVCQLDAVGLVDSDYCECGSEEQLGPCHILQTRPLCETARRAFWADRQQSGHQAPGAGRWTLTDG